MLKPLVASEKLFNGLGVAIIVGQSLVTFSREITFYEFIFFVRGCIFALCRPVVEIYKHCETKNLHLAAFLPPSHYAKRGHGF